MIKMIVSDMDGTLLSKGETITAKNIEAIKKEMENGCKFVIASGRSYSGVKPVMDRYNLTTSMILGNGAQFIDESGTLKLSNYYPKEVLSEVVAIFERLDIYFMIFASNDTYYSIQNPLDVQTAFLHRSADRFGEMTYEELLAHPTKCYPSKNLKKISVQELIENDIEIIKVEAFDTNTAKIAAAKKELKDVSNIAYLSSFDDNVEVTAQVAQKGHILKQVIEIYGIDEKEVIVLGDGMNDISMFEEFTYSFAPSNAEAKIKSLAYKVVTDCHHDAIAEALAIARDL